MTNQEATTGLNDARQTIDEVDRELVRLLAQRMETVRDIGEIKDGDPNSRVHDPDRERRIHETWAKIAEEQGLSTYFVGRILREVLNYSRRGQEDFLQQTRTDAVRVAYQGVPGAFSDLAITKLFALREEHDVDKRGFMTFAECADALEKGAVDYALLPVENSIAGGIGDVSRLISERPLHVIGEETWSIDHCLAALPGTTIGELRTIRSHPIALQQCQVALDELRGKTLEPFYDTAGAAQAIAEEEDRTVGAICSEEAALLHGLVVLRHSVADQEDNQTRFLLLSREPETCDPRVPSKTSMILTVSHKKGALVKCLQIFDEHGINLTRLESRPRPEIPWEYLFFVDLEGHQEAPNVAAALTGLRPFVNHLRVLGSYPSRRIEGATVELSPQTQNDKPQPVTTPEAKVESVADDKRPTPTSIDVGGVEIGGDRFVLISGPCAVETKEQIFAGAKMVKANGARLLRGGAFKPRTSPYSFQGLGFPGLDMLKDAGQKYDLPIVTEVMRQDDVHRIAEKADMIQVGARNMQNFALLTELGKINKPILLKRGMSATVDELLQATEYILAGGNQRVVLCERGIRTFETSTRATLDVSAVPVLKERTHLPVIVDPSHAAGRRDLVIPLALAAVAVGADGLIVEAHPNPEDALCDKAQALTPEDLENMVSEIRRLLAGQGRQM